MNEYYLYASKRAITLTDATVSVLPLSFVPFSSTSGWTSTTAVTVAGVSYNNWFLRGSNLHLVHTNPKTWTDFYDAVCGNSTEAEWVSHGFMGSPDTQISVTYDYQLWNDTTNTLDQSSITEALTLRVDEIERYYKLFGIDAADWSSQEFSSYDSNHAPVVVTDDNVEKYDQRGIQNEFSVDPLTGELDFNPHENLLLNPGFLMEVSGIPIEWLQTDGVSSLVTSNSTNGVYPVYGNKMVSFSSTSGIYQVIRPRNNGAMNISAYVYPNSTSGIWTSSTSGVLRIVANPIDVNGDYLDEDDNVISAAYDELVEVLYTDIDVDHSEWNRVAARLNDDRDFFEDESVFLGDLPESTYQVEIRYVFTNFTGYLDAAQVHEKAANAPFLGVNGATTIEYETDPGGLYIPADSTPFYYGAPNLSTMSVAKTDGYLAFLDDGYIDDWQLGLGGTISTNVGSTSAVFGRVYLPYAQTSGCAKIIERQTFHDGGWFVEDELPHEAEEIRSNSVELVTPENSYVDTNNILHTVTTQNTGATFVALFYDQFDNPWPFEQFDISIMDPTELVLASATGTTDRSGIGRYTYTPSTSSTTGVSMELVKFSTAYTSTTVHIDFHPDTVL